MFSMLPTGNVVVVPYVSFRNERKNSSASAKKIPSSTQQKIQVIFDETQKIHSDTIFYCCFISAEQNWIAKTTSKIELPQQLLFKSNAKGDSRDDSESKMWCHFRCIKIWSRNKKNRSDKHTSQKVSSTLIFPTERKTKTVPAKRIIKGLNLYLLSVSLMPARKSYNPLGKNTHLPQMQQNLKWASEPPEVDDQLQLKVHGKKNIWKGLCLVKLHLLWKRFSSVSVCVCDQCFRKVIHILQKKKNGWDLGVLQLSSCNWDGPWDYEIRPDIA